MLIIRINKSWPWLPAVPVVTRIFQKHQQSSSKELQQIWAPADTSNRGIGKLFTELSIMLTKNFLQNLPSNKSIKLRIKLQMILVQISIQFICSKYLENTRKELQILKEGCPLFLSQWGLLYLKITLENNWEVPLPICLSCYQKVETCVKNLQCRYLNH